METFHEAEKSKKLDIVKNQMDDLLRFVNNYLTLNVAIATFGLGF